MERQDEKDWQTCCTEMTHAMRANTSTV